jgi:glycerol kinase
LRARILAIDQGTTSTRAFLFDETLAPLGFAQLEFPQIYSAPGWVEHDPQGLWTTSAATARAAMASAGVTAGELAAIGITNQRETTILWDRATGKPIHNAIVWQDRRTHEACAALARAGHEKLVSARTGLLLDPYFSATKISWLLDNVAGAREAAQAGKLAFGTVDTYLLWQFTGGKVHATDATNAARTLLLDIHSGQWDAELLDLFGIPAALLPEVRDSASDFGTTLPHLLGGAVNIFGIAGDQQAATVGQGCFEPGMMK